MTVVGVVSHDVEPHRCTRRALRTHFAHAVARPRMAAVGAAFNAMVGLEVVFVADGVIAFLCGWKS